jgi:hypothetical protein
MHANTLCFKLGIYSSAEMVARTVEHFRTITWRIAAGSNVSLLWGLCERVCVSGTLIMTLMQSVLPFGSPMWDSRSVSQV